MSAIGALGGERRKRRHVQQRNEGSMTVSEFHLSHGGEEEEGKRIRPTLKIAGFC